jgi:hypothetical protein
MKILNIKINNEPHNCFIEAVLSDKAESGYTIQTIINPGDDLDDYEFIKKQMTTAVRHAIEHLNVAPKDFLRSWHFKWLGQSLVMPGKYLARDAVHEIELENPGRKRHIGNRFATGRPENTELLAEVKRLKEESGLKNIEIAELLGVTRGRITQILKNEK